MCTVRASTKNSTPEEQLSRRTLITLIALSTTATQIAGAASARNTSGNRHFHNAVTVLARVY